MPRRLRAGRRLSGLRGRRRLRADHLRLQGRLAPRDGVALSRGRQVLHRKDEQVLLELGRSWDDIAALKAVDTIS